MTNTKTAIMLTVSKNKIFDGTYSYIFASSEQYEQGLVRFYKHSQTGNSITFPSFPIEIIREVDTRHVMFGDPKTTVAMFFNCFNLQQIKVYRSKLKK